MPRVTIPAEVSRQGDLASLDPRRMALAGARTQQDASGTVTVAAHGPGFYRIQSKLQSPSLLRVAEAWYPGWEVTVNGKAAEVLKVDGALMGVVAPAGEAEVVLRFQLRNLRLGLGVSLVTLAAGIALVVWKRRELLLGLD
ncbi:MAG: YfhO family protein [Bryobacterales bacterium]|nr:YfhO family protein [Bryobacterales bacterium]